MTYFINRCGYTETELKRDVVPQIIEFDQIIKKNRRPSMLLAEVRTSPIHGNGLFALRDYKKGEVLACSGQDCARKLVYLNDAVIIPDCDLLKSFEEVKNFYSMMIPLYKKQSDLRCNLKIVNVKDSKYPERKVGTILITRDIKRGEEMLRTYGVPTWLVMTSERLETCVFYWEWIFRNFRRLYDEADEDEKDEARSTLCFKMDLVPADTFSH